MLRYVVCSVVTLALMLGLARVLHSLQELGLWPYLSICAVLVTAMYLAARAYDARHPVQEVLPPKPPGFLPSAQSRRLPGAE